MSLFQRPPIRESLVACAAALTILLSACGTNAANQSGNSTAGGPPCATVYRAMGLDPTNGSYAGKCIAQHLQVMGEIHGSVDWAYVRQPCARPERAAQDPLTDMDVVLNNLHYQLSLYPDVKYNRAAATEVINPAPNQPSVALSYHAQTSGTNFIWSATAGSLNVDVTGVAGTVDASLAQDNGKAPLHVKGSWRCGEVQPLTLDPALASTPCGALYYLAHLTSSDIDRVKSEGGCIAQDLSLTGSVTGHATEAVNDPGSAKSLFSAPQQGCAYSTEYPYYPPDPNSKDYTSNVHFLIEDEVFSIRVTEYPRASGTYNAFTRFPFGAGLSAPSPTVTLYDDRPATFLNDHPDRLTSWSSTAGTLTIAPDALSGTVDMELTGGVSGADKAHVAGSWRCAPAGAGH